MSRGRGHGTERDGRGGVSTEVEVLERMERVGGGVKAGVDRTRVIQGIGDGRGVGGGMSKGRG